MIIENQFDGLLNDLCFPFTYMPVYRHEGERAWVDSEQISTKINREYKATVKNCYIIGEVEYHPFRTASFINTANMKAKII